MITRALIVLFTGILLLAACGKKQSLEPASGHSLPMKPEGAPIQPNSDALLNVPADYRPGRSDELLQRSVTRPDDRFDLPPR
jgi:hypothetical protein